MVFLLQESPLNVASLIAMELECDLGAIQNEELLRKMVSDRLGVIKQSAFVSI